MQLAIDSHRSRLLRLALCLALALVIALPSVTWFMSRAEAIAKPSEISVATTARWPVAAVGRIEPNQGLLDIAAPAWGMGSAIVTAMHVRQGDWVDPGQVFAELRGRDELDAVLAGRERKVAVARARLAAVKTGGKEDDIRALRSEVESDEVALAQVQADTTRTQQLREEGVVSAAAMQAQRSRLIAASRSLDAKRACLNALSSVRPADVSVGEAELQAAEAEAQEIRVKLESTLVRARAAGRVLAVHAYPGQRVGAEGLLTLGDHRRHA